MTMGMKRELRAPYDEALLQVVEALKTEGFGVLTEVDIKETLKKKLATMQAGGPEADTLASRAELAMLKKPMAGGGFITFGQMLRRFAALDAEDNDAKDLIHVLDKLPAKGESPIFLTVSGTAGEAPKIKWTTTLDGRWVKDLTTLGILADKDELEAPQSTPPSRP